MAVNQVELALLRERLARGEHVLVHALHPRHEPVEIAWPARLAHAVNAQASRPLARATPCDAVAGGAREHVNRRPLSRERLR